MTNKKQLIGIFLGFLLMLGTLTVLSGILGGSFDPLGFGPVLWGLSPVLTTLVFSLIFRRWKTLGLAFSFRTSGKTYLLILIAVPLLTVLGLALNLLLNLVEWTGTDIGSSLTAIAFGLPVFLILAFLEEIAWRGFLVPLLEEMEIGRYWNVLIIALVWTAWHLPFLSQLTWVYRTSDIAWFLPSFFLINIAYSLIYLELRTSSNSLWPVVLMHGLTNAIQHPLALENLRISTDLGFLASFGGLIMTALLCGFYVFLRVRSIKAKG